MTKSASNQTDSSGGAFTSRRRALQLGVGGLGATLPGFLHLRDAAADTTNNSQRSPKSCIVLYCWGGMSHFESWDPKPHAPKEIRGLFPPIHTATPGIQFSEHIPFLARQTEHLAVIRSIHHRSSAHGKGMYWNMTGHPPPQTGTPANLTPDQRDWPSLAAMVSQFRTSGRGVPRAMRLPYPLVDNGTLQAGEYGGWLGAAADPIVVRTPKGKAFGGVSRDLGSPVLNMADGVNRSRLQARHALLNRLETGGGDSTTLGAAAQATSTKSFDHFRDLAIDMLLSDRVKNAFDLDREPEKSRRAYGDHICGTSILLARRLTDVGVPIVTVCCAAGDLNGSKGDHWDTHGNNFNRLKNTMLPAFDKPAAILLQDLADRGRLDDTLVVFLTEFGRTPKINGSAGRDHYPHAYSVALAGAGIRGGQVYGSSNAHGAHPHKLACGPNDLHATIFQALGISPTAHLRDNLGRPLPITDGRPLPLF